MEVQGSSTPPPTPAAPVPGRPSAPAQPPQRQPGTTQQQPGSRAPRQAARQGQPPQQQADGFWGNFPNIPPEQRAALEPHLREVQRYVTQVEQKAAPFKDYTPEQVRGLASFATQFDQNPLGMFLSLAEDLQGRGIIHGDLDLEALAAVVQGQDPDELPIGGAPQLGEGEEGEIPPWARQLLETVEELQVGRDQEQQQRQERVEDAALQRQLDAFKTQLTQAGFPENAVTEQRMIAALIANNGDLEAAVAAEMDFRSSVLSGVVSTGDEEDLNLPRGVPSHEAPTTPKRSSRDPFKQVRGGAEQFLRQAAKDSQ